MAPFIVLALIWDALSLIPGTCDPLSGMGVDLVAQGVAPTTKIKHILTVYFNTTVNHSINFIEQSN